MWPCRVLTSLLWLFQFSPVTQSCPTLCNPMNRSTPGLPDHHQLLEFTQTHVCWVGVAIQPSHPLSAPSPPALNLSQLQDLFKWVSSSHQVAKVLEFQLQHQSFQWTPRTDSFRMDWLDLLAVQGTLKNLLQHHSSKASILRCSAFFIVTLWGNLKLCLVMFSSYLDDVWCCLFANSDSEGEYQSEKFYCTFHP